MQKQKQSSLEQVFKKLVKIISKIIKRKIDVWKEKRAIQKEFDKQVKNNIKKNQLYKKIKNTKQHSLDNKLY